MYPSWQGDPRLVRLGYTATAALRYGFSANAVSMLDPQRRAFYERVLGHPVEEILDRVALVHRFLHARGDEARALLHLV